MVITTTTTTAEPRIGEPITTPGGNTVTAHELQLPARVNRTMVLEPDPGMQFAALDMEFCTEPTFDATNVSPIYESDFTLQDADNRVWSFWNVQDYAVAPRWPDELPQPGQCIRGWTTFQVPSDASIVRIRFDTVGNGRGPFMVWAV